MALRTESRLKKTFSMGINCMSLQVWLAGAVRKCSAAVVGLDFQAVAKLVRYFEMSKVQIRCPYFVLPSPLFAFSCLGPRGYCWVKVTFENTDIE